MAEFWRSKGATFVEVRREFVKYFLLGWQEESGIGISARVHFGRPCPIFRFVEEFQMRSHLGSKVLPIKIERADGFVQKVYFHHPGVHLSGFWWLLHDPGLTPPVFT